MKKTLADTVEQMNSEDYRERFKAEYYQLVYRFYHLKNILCNWDKLTFDPDCNKGILEMQLRVMADYICILESRAQIEHIDLEEV